MMICRILEIRLLFQILRRTDGVAALLSRALPLYEFTKQPNGDKLKGGHHQQHAEKQKRPVADRSESRQPQYAQIGQDTGAGQTEYQTGTTEDVQRSCRKAGVQHDTEKIQSAFQQAADSIFRFTELTGVMGDRNFANAVAAPVQQNRNEPMQFTVKRQPFKRFGPIGLVTAVEIVQLHPAEATDNSVEDSRG